jgi:hypothetical protein
VSGSSVIQLFQFLHILSRSYRANHSCQFIFFFGLETGWPDWAIFHLLGDWFFGGISNSLCLSSSLALHFFRSFFLGPPPCQPGWPASPCTCNGLWLLSPMPTSLKVAPEIWATFLRCKNKELKSAKVGFGLRFGRFFHELIWSPCLETKSGVKKNFVFASTTRRKKTRTDRKSGNRPQLW